MKRVLLTLALLSALAHADPLEARDTAMLGQAGEGRVGIFNPLVISIHDRVELQAHPLVFLVAPHVDARIGLIQGPLALTVEVGVSVPTFGLRLTKGYLFPSWATSTNDIGWMLIPRGGLLLSATVLDEDVFTVKVDGAFRASLGPNSAMPATTFLAPLEVLLAAPLTGSCLHAGLAYDKALGEGLRLRGAVDAYLTGPQGDLIVDGQDVGTLEPLSPLILSAHVGLDIAVTDHSRFTVGVLWGNYDSGATALRTDADGYSVRERVRSNNFLPTIDYIWEW